jgi:hypothetical protein
MREAACRPEPDLGLDELHRELLGSAVGPIPLAQEGDVVFLGVILAAGEDGLGRRDQAHIRAVRYGSDPGT